MSEHETGSYEFSHLDLEGALEYSLRRQSLKVPLNYDELISKADMVQRYGINGAALAIFEMPADAAGKHRQIAVIDHGPITTSVHDRDAIMTMDGKPMQAAGIITQQYALAGLNYHPETHIFPYKPLFDGDVTDVGRAVESDAGYFLGLQDVMSVSRSHFDICVTIHDNNLSIEDHSTHGTKVYIAGPGK